MTTLERLVDILEKEYDQDHWAINHATIEPEVAACAHPELLGRWDKSFEDASALTSPRPSPE